MVRQRVPWALLSALYCTILATGLIVAAIIAAGPLDVIVGPAAWSVLLGLLVAAIGLAYGLSGRNAAIATMALVIGALISGGQVARVLDFVTKAMGFPLADAWLAQWDVRLGLDWRAHHDWMLQHGQFTMVLGLLYRPTQLFVAAAVIVLTAKNLHREAATFALAIVASLLICVVAGGFFPAVGPYGYFGLPDHGIAPWMGTIAAVASGDMLVADLSDLPALTTFPSYHSSIAVLAALACWRAGRVGKVISGLNVLWLFGVPFWGDHYIVDVVAGVAIAFACHLVLFRRFISHGSDAADLTDILPDTDLVEVADAPLITEAVQVQEPVQGNAPAAFRSHS